MRGTIGISASNPEHDEYLASLKRPLILSNIMESPTSPVDTSMDSNSSFFGNDECLEQAKFQIIPDKTGLKISPLYSFQYDHHRGRNNFYDNCNSILNKSKNKLKSTARPLLFW